MQPLEWSLREPFQFHWDAEILRLDVPKGAPANRIRALTDGSKTYAAQYDPEANVVIACLDLAPGQALSLTPTDVAPEVTGLHAEVAGGVIVLRNRFATFAFASRAEAVSQGERWLVPGPLVSLSGPDRVPRCTSRIRFDKSRFFSHDRASIGRATPAALAEEEIPPTVTTRLVATGPVFAQYRYDLCLSDDRTYTFTATLYAEQPILYIREETALDREGNVEWAIGENFPCDAYFFGGTEGQNRQSLVPLPPHEYRLGSLSPHHTQCQLAYPWLGFVQSNRPQAAFRGICDRDIDAYTDTLVFMGHKPWDWHYPGDVTLQFHCHEGRRPVAYGPLRHGLRTWCLFVTHRNEISRLHRFEAYGETRTVSPFAVWHRRLNDLPLDWVRRLDLTSGTVPPTAFPGSVLTPNEWVEKRSGVWREMAPLLADKLSRGDSAALYARWILHEDRKAAQELARQIAPMMESKLALAFNSGFLPDALCAVANRGLGPAAVYYEACVAAQAFTPAETERLRVIFLLFAYASAGDALFPSHHNYLPPDHTKSARNWLTTELYSDVFGTPNFQTDVYYNLGLFGAVFRTHPQATAWMHEAADQMDQQLDYHFHAGGVYEESIGYFTHLFHNMLHLASVLKRQDVRDFYADPRFQAAMDTLVDYLGAPRHDSVERWVHPGHPREGLRRYWPAIGDTGHNATEAELLALMGHAAWEVREHNHALSDRILSAWSECDRPLWGVHHPMFEFLYFQDLNPRCAPLRLAPRRFTNVGVMFRADEGSPSETSLFFRSGRATHHWGFDHGHFTLTTRGSLLIPDFGYHGTELPAEGAMVPGWATWVHNVCTFGPHWNSGTGVERQGSERVIALADDFDYVVADLCTTMVRSTSWRNVHPITGVEYYRHLLFAHNRYILVWDRIDFSVYPSQLRINGLAKAVTVDGPRARFTGLDGVDLQVTVLAPEAPEIHEGRVGPMRYLLCEQACQKDYLWLCQPVGPGEQEFTVTASPNVVTVKGTDLHGVAFEDHILYTKGDAPVTVPIGNRSRTLHGRLAVIHQQAGTEVVRLLDAQAVSP